MRFSAAQNDSEESCLVRTLGLPQSVLKMRCGVLFALVFLVVFASSSDLDWIEHSDLQEPDAGSALYATNPDTSLFLLNEDGSLSENDGGERSGHIFVAAQDDCSSPHSADLSVRVRKRSSACSVPNPDLPGADNDVPLEIPDATRVIPSDTDLNRACPVSINGLPTLPVCSSGDPYDMLFDEYNSILFNYEIGKFFNSPAADVRQQLLFGGTTEVEP
jgi:hypothetical protein